MLQDEVFVLQKLIFLIPTDPNYPDYKGGVGGKSSHWVWHSKAIPETNPPMPGKP
jgi:hypothetical protein